ncbi:unnamed protein product [Musa acuminata subsp. malaccensis]|uniref:(wild Malaysian banana) hypothetical protein n=1 Tax=Musa acuminata subsp. malaccensis TaxID=214687 RepID=A0A8D7AQM8_MUSAM|nr:unnamed protein product [Musa acuminata subsp. malaccensis]
MHPDTRKINLSHSIDGGTEKSLMVFGSLSHKHRDKKDVLDQVVPEKKNSYNLIESLRDLHYALQSGLPPCGFSSLFLHLSTHLHQHIFQPLLPLLPQAKHQPFQLLSCQQDLHLAASCLVSNTSISFLWLHLFSPFPRSASLHAVAHGSLQAPSGTREKGVDISNQRWQEPSPTSKRRSDPRDLTSQS